MRPIDAPVVPGDWTAQFATAVAAAVKEFACGLETTPIILFAVDCHPWNGSLGLALLTAEEADADALLVDPAEMAAWRHYHFTDELSSWEPTRALACEMQKAYEAADDRIAAVASILQACADSLTSGEVGAAIALLDRDVRFRVSVAHPDDGREFYPTP